MSSWVGQFHDFTKKYDPLGHALVNGAWKSSTKLVNETHRGIEKASDKVGVKNPWATFWKDTSQKDKDSFNRWGENTLGAAAAVYGGMSALGGEAAAGGGSAAGGSGGAFGASGVPWAGGVDAGASGLGYAEAGGGFVGNGAGGSTGSFFGNGASSFNPQMAQQGAKMFGNKGQQGADGAAIQRQLALAEMMRRHREDQETTGMPGWVEMA